MSENKMCAVANSLRLSWLVYILASIAIGTLTVLVPFIYFVALIASITVLVVACSKPELGVIALVFCLSGVNFEEALPIISIGVGSLHVQDIVLLALLATTLSKSIRGSRHNTRTPLDKPLMLFYSLVVISAVVGVVYYGVAFRDMIKVLRALTYYLTFFVVTRLITEQKQVEYVIRGLFIVGIVVATTMILQAMIGDSVRLMSGRIEQARTMGTEYETVRMMHPGHTLIYIILLVSLTIAAVRRSNIVTYIIVSLVTGLAVLLTYNRGFWVSILGLLMLMFVLLGKKAKIRLSMGLLTCMLVTTLGLYCYKDSAKLISVSYAAVVDRFESLFGNESLLQSRSLQDRYLENSYAIDKIQQSPLWGVGLGSEYRPDLFGADDELNRYIHNGFLWMIMNMGLTGFMVFLWFYAIFLSRGMRSWRKFRDRRSQAVVLGFTLSGLGILGIEMVHPLFMQRPSILLIAIMAGLIEVMIRQQVRNG